MPSFKSAAEDWLDGTPADNATLNLFVQQIHGFTVYVRIHCSFGFSARQCTWTDAVSAGSHPAAQRQVLLQMANTQAMHTEGLKKQQTTQAAWCWLFMLWNIFLWADDDKLPDLQSQEAGPRTRKNGFQYVSASGQRTSTVPVTEGLTWGNCHQEMKHFYCFHPLFTNCHRGCNEKVEVIHQQMDVDNEVIRVWKRTNATNLDLLKDDEYAEAVSGRNEFYQIWK